MALTEKIVTRYVASDGREFSGKLEATKYEAATELARFIYGDEDLTPCPVQIIQDLINEKAQFDKIFNHYFKEAK